MRNILGKTLTTIALGVMLVGAALAQVANPNPSAGGGAGVQDPNHPRVNEVNGREGEQQNRIRAGAKNGSLTPGQAARLERNDRAIQREEKQDMAAHNGHLTKGEQNQINRQLNGQSKQIYKDKHQ